MLSVINRYYVCKKLVLRATVHYWELSFASKMQFIMNEITFETQSEIALSCEAFQYGTMIS